MHNEIYAIAKHYGDDCRNCKEVCCVNMALTISRDEQKNMAKHLKMEHDEFRKKYTVLFRSLFGGKCEVKTLSEEAKQQYKNNPRLLKFIEANPEEIGLPEEQIKRLIEIKQEFKGKELRILVCPFFEKNTHRCKIHEVRPGACFLYPFNYGIDADAIDLRKVNTCVLSTRFLERFVEFADKMHLHPEPLKKVLENKEYHNHFYLPKIIVYAYLVYECEKLKIPLSSPRLIELKKEIFGGMSYGSQ